MHRSIRRFQPATLVILSLALILVIPAATATAGDVSATEKYAWATNAGWLNFNSTHGTVSVYDDHLEGYAWAENVGWIRLGTYTGGGAHSYANTSSTDYGVNHDGAGTLSGYAWGTNVGWINFNPTHGGVTIDPATGDFDGYAWAENIGWIHFQKTGTPAYKVVVAGAFPPEIDVKGNGVSIADGDTSPSAGDDTDFGAADINGGTVQQTFGIYNTGSGDLNLSGSPRVAVSGANASDFTVTAQPLSPVPGGGSVSFQVKFDPSGTGTRQATLSIANSDANENPYTFQIEGTGTLAAEIDVQGNGQSIASGDNTPDSVDGTEFGGADIDGPQSPGPLQFSTLAGSTCH